MRRVTQRTLPAGAAVMAAVAVGAMVGAQGRINGALAGRTHSALSAATISFVIGLAMVAAPASSRTAAFARLRTGPVKAWWWFGGFGGAFLVSTTAHGVPEIGVALVSVCLVAGTTSGALLTDRFGLGPSGRHPVSVWRVVGVTVVIAAVAVGAIGQSGAALRPALFAVLFVAGAGAAVQQAANGQLRAVADDVVVASFVSFLGGTIALLVTSAVAGQLLPLHLPAAPWLYLGGPLGVVYILVGAATVRTLGVLRFILGTVAGQLLAAVVIDAAWPEPGTSLSATTVVGAAITVVGVWLSGRDPDHRTAPPPEAGLGVDPAADSAADYGDADLGLVVALASGDAATIRAAVLAARLLVPIVASGEESRGAQLAVPRLVGRDGRHALPVFSSYDALRAWQPDARPVPMSGAQAAAGALAEGYAALVLDVAGPRSHVVEISAVAT